MRHKEAIESCTDALKLDANNAQALLERGHFLINPREADKAPAQQSGFGSVASYYELQRIEAVIAFASISRSARAGTCQPVLANRRRHKSSSTDHHRHNQWNVPVADSIRGLALASRSPDPKFFFARSHKLLDMIAIASYILRRCARRKETSQLRWSGNGVRFVCM